MENILCLNFCELLSYFVNEETSSQGMKEAMQDLLSGESCHRIYFGSSFCSQYFLQLDMGEVKRLIEICNELHIKLTLVVPVFSEKDLQSGKQKIALFQPYFRGHIDEVTVNDYGMLEYIHSNYKVRLNLGRLFMKDYRDPRYEEFTSQKVRPNLFNPMFQQLVSNYLIHGMEFDGGHKVIDLTEAFPDMELGVHLPFCYLTEGNICGYASLASDRAYKFRPNHSCQKECQQHAILYQVGEQQWIRFGRTIYYPSPTEEIVGYDRVRTIYFPLEKVVRQ